ncbi:4-hydroxyphenylpyruvate dioxygenase, partial [Lecanoromycetidae sp. Uapishka_2]
MSNHGTSSSYPVTPETLAKAGDDPRTGLNANASTFIPNDVTVAHSPLVPETEAAEEHDHHVGTDVAVDTSITTGSAKAAVKTGTLSADALAFEPAKAAMNVSIAGPTDESMPNNAYRKVMDPFFAQVPTGPRRQPMLVQSKPASQLASFMDHPFLYQFPTALQQQRQFFPSKPVTPKTYENGLSFPNQDQTGSQQQPLSPWPITASPFLNQISLEPQQQSVSARPNPASPLTQSDRDLFVDEAGSSTSRHLLLNTFKTSSPLAEDDDTNVSTPLSFHQRVTSSPYNQIASNATTPPSDPSRPRLRVQIPNTPTSFIKRVPPLALQAQPSHNDPGNHFDVGFASRVAGAAHTGVTNLGASAAPTRVPNPRPSHTNSKTWTRPETAEHERWLAIEKRLQKMEFIGPEEQGKDNIQRSPFVPKTWKAYLEHRRLYKMDLLRERKRKLAAMEKTSVRDPRLPPPGPKVRIGPAFGGKHFHDNRSSVLAQFTVYSPWYHYQGRPEAQWPCPQEMAEEGDERYTSNFRRMTAVPRDPCNETVSYKQRPFVIPMPLDAIWGSPWRVPTAENVERMKILDDEMRTEKEIGEELIGQSLLDAIDCIDDDQWYITRMGFEEIAHKGLTTGSKYIEAHVVANKNVMFVLISPLRPAADKDASIAFKDKHQLEEIHEHLRIHGDGVKDVAFAVDDVRAVYDTAVSKGAEVAKKPTVIRDEDGEMVVAIVKTFGDTTHTLVERSKYKGVFMPGYSAVNTKDVINAIAPPIYLDFIDHAVGNLDWGCLQSTEEYYVNCLSFKRFWNIDDKNAFGMFSSMKSVVVSSSNEAIKMPLNEPAVGKKKSQIEDFVDFYGGAGVQHIAFHTKDIIGCVENLRKRGVEFLSVPHTYYVDVRKRLAKKGTEVVEDLETLEAQNILIDFDDSGYLLQIFTKTLSGRPTVFLEIIQRKNFNGFGAGNFKALFEAVEREQAARDEL